jgi:hypothetical protein
MKWVFLIVALPIVAMFGAGMGLVLGAIVGFLIKSGLIK